MVYLGYHEVLKMYPNRIKVVDGSKPLDEVINDVKKIIYSYLEEINERK
jgi:dTMP kinase